MGSLDWGFGSGSSATCVRVQKRNNVEVGEGRPHFGIFIGL